MLWIFIFLFMTLASLAGLFFVIYKVAHFSFITRRYQGRKAYLVSLALVAILMLALFLWGGVWNTMIIFIHLLLFWLVFELVFVLLARLTGHKNLRRFSSPVALIFTFIYIAVGVFLVYHVQKTEYSLDGRLPIRLVGFSDSHMGTTLDSTDLAAYIEEMNKEDADIAVIVGDFIDDDTPYDLMVESCQALSRLKTKYGVYYVFGNHDAGYYNSRGYGRDELIKELKAAGVVVLEDQLVKITDTFYLCGRLDASYSHRKSIGSLLAETRPDDYVIVLDHQPTDYTAEAAAGADLVLSGHTHGGQFFPITAAGEWLGINDMTYGHDRIASTDFIVSSGISNWAFKLKTGCISEFFVIE